MGYTFIFDFFLSQCVYSCDEHAFLTLKSRAPQWRMHALILLGGCIGMFNSSFEFIILKNIFEILGFEGLYINIYLIFYIARGFISFVQCYDHLCYLVVLYVYQYLVVFLDSIIIIIIIIIIIMLSLLSELVLMMKIAVLIA